MRFFIIFFSFILFFQFIFNSSFAQEKSNDSLQTENLVTAVYNKKGFQLSTRDDYFSSKIELRLQSRFYTFRDPDPRSPSSFEGGNNPAFIFRRVRIKSKGHVYNKWFRYKFEYDLGISRLYDFYFSYEKFNAFKIRFGQYKAPFNRLRIISSGDQTLPERSIVTRVFTIDRQVGLTFSGNVGQENPANFSYLFSVYTGAGSLGRVNDDNNMLYVGRFQWNVLGREIGVGEPDSDVENSQKPKASIAIASATNTSPYTRFSSSSGGGLLDFYDESLPGQYKVDQYEQDFAFKYKGFSILEEYHRKSIDDRINDDTRELEGFFVQMGLFPGYLIEGLPEPLQFAARYAYVDNDIDTDPIDRNEYTVGVNWYFNGFRNRLMVDFSSLNLIQPNGEDLNAKRFRVQWDITI